MKQVVYLDVLIFLNTVITFLLLLTSSRILKIYPSPGRFVISSVLGGVSSLIILAPEFGFFLSVITKVLFSLVIVITAYNPKSLRRIAKLTAYFFAVNFVFAGMMLFASSLPGISLVNYNNGAVYINLSFFSLVAACVVCYAVTCFLGKITKHRSTEGLLYSIEISSKGKTVKCSALLDTGNSLTDPFTGESLIIADKITVADILPQSIDTYLKNGECDTGIKLIPCRTVSSDTLLPCFRADYVKIKDDRSIRMINDVEIAVSNNMLDNVILPMDLFENNERRSTNVTTTG